MEINTEGDDLIVVCRGLSDCYLLSNMMMLAKFNDQASIDVLLSPGLNSLLKATINRILSEHPEYAEIMRGWVNDLHRARVVAVVRSLYEGADNIDELIAEALFPGGLT